MIAFCLICEGKVRFVDTPMGIEAHCEHYGPVEDSAEGCECLRGLGEDKRDAVEDLYRVQNEYLEDASAALVNVYEELARQVDEESLRQNSVIFVVDKYTTHIPGAAMALAKWAAQGK